MEHGNTAAYAQHKYTVSQKNVHLFIFQTTLSKIDIFNDFWCLLNPEKI